MEVNGNFVQKILSEKTNAKINRYIGFMFRRFTRGALRNEQLVDLLIR